MTHLWVRAEQRANEDRVGLTPDGARKLIEKGIQVSVENSQSRIIPIADYADAGGSGCQHERWQSYRSPHAAGSPVCATGRIDGSAAAGRFSPAPHAFQLIKRDQHSADRGVFFE